MNTAIANIPNPKLLLPKKQLVADDIKSDRAASWIENTTYAIHRPYISVNNPEVKRANVIIIDCDHEDYDYFPGGFPLPWVTTISPKTGRPHHVFQLEVPVLTGLGASIKAQRLLAAIERAFVWHLNGDERYAGHLTKNPWYDPKSRETEASFRLSPPNSALRTGWHSIWWPNSKPINLSELTAWCDIEPKPKDELRSYLPDSVPQLSLSR